MLLRIGERSGYCYLKYVIKQKKLHPECLLFNPSFSQNRCSLYSKNLFLFNRICIVSFFFFLRPFLHSCTRYFRESEKSQKNMHSWNICIEVIWGIDEDMDNREEHEEEIWARTSLPEDKDTHKQGDEYAWEDVATVFSILFHPVWWYWEKVPKWNSDQSCWHEIRSWWCFSSSSCCYLTDVECMVILTIRAAECDSQKFIHAQETRENVSFAFFIRGYPLDEGTHDEFTTQKYIHRKDNKNQKWKCSYSCHKKSSFIRKNSGSEYHEEKEWSETATTGRERMFVFSCDIDTKEGNHTRHKSDFIILILDSNSCCIIREYVLHGESIGII